MSHINRDGYKIIGKKGRDLEHRKVVEKALGKPLPKGSIVHHINGDRLDNSPKNLVLCPNQAYHLLLHLREEALRESGDANKLRCGICKQFDDRKNLWQRRFHTEAKHRHCWARLARERRAAG
jgi:hypothetical protein